MDFGVVLQTNPPASRVVELAKMAEDLGFTHGWTFDSHVLWQEPFVIYSRILAETERMIVGPMVTNPRTRDWSVLASMFATLNDMYGPRTICGMGRGDSAVRYTGSKPTTIDSMVDSMAMIKSLVAGDTVSLRDTEFDLPWVEDGWDLQMWAAGYGPRALADGRRARRRFHPSTCRSLDTRVDDGSRPYCGIRRWTQPRRHQDLCGRARIRGR